MLSKLSLPVKIGLGFGVAGILLVLVGILRGNVPPNPASIAVALLIGGGFWFLVAWAVATAAVDVETDIAEGEIAEGEIAEGEIAEGDAPTLDDAVI